MRMRFGFGNLKSWKRKELGCGSSCLFLELFFATF
jgi:hypothetical protein